MLSDSEFRIHPCEDGGYVVFYENHMDAFKRRDAFAGTLDACLEYIRVKLTAAIPETPTQDAVD